MVTKGKINATKPRQPSPPGYPRLQRGSTGTPGPLDHVYPTTRSGGGAVKRRMFRPARA